MKRSFHIRSVSAPKNDDNILLLECADHSFWFGLFERSTRTLREAGYFESDKSERLDPRQVFSQFPSLSATNETAISYWSPSTILIPADVFHSDQAELQMEMVNGKDIYSTVSSETLPAADIKVAYRTNTRSREFINETFRERKNFNHFAVQLNKNESGTALYADFRTEEFSVLALKDGKVMLAQIYAYTTPVDVLYHLLKMTDVFSFSRRDIVLHLSGWIDKDSALAAELTKFFIHLDFEDLPAGISLDEAFAEYPAHYFASLCKLAACVS